MEEEDDDDWETEEEWTTDEEEVSVIHPPTVEVEWMMGRVLK